MNCIFCDIANKKAQAEILYENERVISFLDINPMNFGHALVIPRKHYDNFLDVPVEELDGIIRIVHLISSAVKTSVKPDGFNIIINNGKAAGQSIFHFHFHIIPRFHDDEFKFRINLKKYTNGVLKKFGDKIRFELTKQD